MLPVLAIALAIAILAPGIAEAHERPAEETEGGGDSSTSKKRPRGGDRVDGPSFPHHRRGYFQFGEFTALRIVRSGYVTSHPVEFERTALHFSSHHDGITVPSMEPTNESALLIKGKEVDSCRTAITLDPEKWKPIVSDGLRRGYRYVDRTHRGTLRITIRPGQISILSSGAFLYCELPIRQQQLPFSVELRLGDDSYCTTAGDTIAVNEPHLFVAYGKPADEQCPDGELPPLILSASTDSGSPGTVVSLQGRQFLFDTPGAVIRIGDTPAPILRLDENLVAFMIPFRRSGPARIRLENAKGVLSNSIAFEVLEPRLPEMTPSELGETIRNGFSSLLEDLQSPIQSLESEGAIFPEAADEFTRVRAKIDAILAEVSANLSSADPDHAAVIESLLRSAGLFELLEASANPAAVATSVFPSSAQDAHRLLYRLDAADFFLSNVGALASAAAIASAPLLLTPAAPAVLAIAPVLQEIAVVAAIGSIAIEGLFPTDLVYSPEDLAALGENTPVRISVVPLHGAVLNELEEGQLVMRAHFAPEKDVSTVTVDILVLLVTQSFSDYVKEALALESQARIVIDALATLLSNSVGFLDQPILDVSFSRLDLAIELTLDPSIYEETPAVIISVVIPTLPIAQILTLLREFHLIPPPSESVAFSGGNTDAYDSGANIFHTVQPGHEMVTFVPVVFQPVEIGVLSLLIPGVEAPVILEPSVQLFAISPGPEGKFSDDFDDGNFDGWEVIQGSWSVENGELAGMSDAFTDDARIVAGDPSWTDCVFSADMKVFTWDAPSFLFRVSDIGPGVNNGAYYQLEFHNGVDVSLGLIDSSIPGCAAGGSCPTLATAHFPMDAGRFYRVTLAISGNSLDLFVDGAHVMSYGGLTHLAMGKIGFKVIHAGAHAHFDNVVVSSAPPKPSSIFFADFDSGLPPEFSGATTIEPVQDYAGVGAGTNVFDGNLLRNDSGGTPSAPGSVVPKSTVLSLAALPPHTSVSLRFLLAVIDSWGAHAVFGSDVFNVSVDGVLIFSETFDNASTVTQSYVPPPGVQLTSRPFSNVFDTGTLNLDSAYDMGADPIFQRIPHNRNTLTIEWFASGGGWQGFNDESWAIDNVEVKIE